MRLVKFRVRNYRNILDSDWIEVNCLTAFVGQNEAGKSNLFDALYRINPIKPEDVYDFNEDWPVDKWGSQDPKAYPCEATFVIEDKDEFSKFITACQVPPALPEHKEMPAGTVAGADPSNVAVVPAKATALPYPLECTVKRYYDGHLSCRLDDSFVHLIDIKKFEAWIGKNMPIFVLISEYELSGHAVELDQLADRLENQGWNKLSTEDQTILIILELAKIELKDIIKKGGSPGGRTTRAFDTRQASHYLTEQFSQLWKQKKVRFDIRTDGPTLNIFVEDEGFGMPVRLARRSTGFRWHVSFAWKFTHASRGEYKGCILLLEEPGIHLHHAGHHDLLAVLEELAQSNTILYTTHIASMLDAGFPERMRIVEIHDHHTSVIHGVVSTQSIPMMVVEARLGLSPHLSGLLGNRQTLIVEGGTDVLILEKLSGVLKASQHEGLSDRVFLWPADSASKTPMYAAFMVGNKWDAIVLLDTDTAGNLAKRKISDLYLKEIPKEHVFQVLQIGDAAGIEMTDAAIEDLFPEFYLECVNDAYGLAIQEADLPLDGSSQIASRVERVLQAKHGRTELDKKLVMRSMLKRFNAWKTIQDLPSGTLGEVEKLFHKINSIFAHSSSLPGMRAE